MYSFVTLSAPWWFSRRQVLAYHSLPIFCISLLHGYRSYQSLDQTPLQWPCPAPSARTATLIIGRFVSRSIYTAHTAPLSSWSILSNYPKGNSENQLYFDSSLYSLQLSWALSPGKPTALMVLDSRAPKTKTTSNIFSIPSALQVPASNCSGLYCYVFYQNGLPTCYLYLFHQLLDDTLQANRCIPDDYWWFACHIWEYRWSTAYPRRLRNDKWDRRGKAGRRNNGQSWIGCPWSSEVEWETGGDRLT